MRKSRALLSASAISIIAAVFVAGSVLSAQMSAQRGTMGTKNLRGSDSRTVEVAGGTTCPGLNRWDGEGATNNWSEAANWCNNTVPPSGATIVFDFTSVKNVTIDVSVTANIINLNAGYTGVVTLGDQITVTATSITISDGTLNVFAGVLDVNSQLIVQGTGILNGGSGLVRLAGSLTYTNFNGAQFIPAGGTVEFDGVNGAVFVNTPNLSMNFYNVTVNTTTDAGGLYFDTNGGIRSGSVLGTLDLMNGNIGSGVVNAYGPVDYHPTFDGGGGYLYFYGSDPRTIDLPAGTPMVNLMGNFAANTTVNVTGTGTITFGARWDIGGGTFNPGSADVVVQNIQISGGIFNVNTGTNLTSTAIVDITAGLLNAIDAEYVRFSSITVRGAGILNGPTSTMYVGGLFSINEGGGADFYHNNGTAVFDGNNCGVAVNNATAGTTRFHTLIVELPQDSSVFSFDANGGVDSAIVEGHTYLNNGQFVNGTLFTKRSVFVANTFDGGSGSLYFNGPLIQNLVNEGGLNPTGLFTVDKDPGTYVLVSGSSTTFIGSTVVVARGGLFLDTGVDMTFGTLITGTNGYLVVSSAADITVGGSVTNNGRIDLRHQGASCSVSNDRIVLRSSLAGSQRSWNGTGVSLMTGLDVQDMAGAQQFLVWYGLNSGNNGDNWQFFGSCPVTTFVAVSGRAITESGRGIPYAKVTMTNLLGDVHTALTNQFGYFQFDNVRTSEGYLATIAHKSYQFSSPGRQLVVNSAVNDLNFTAANPSLFEDPGEIVGKFAAGNGSQGKERWATISSDEKTEVRTERTDETGSFRFDGLRIGRPYLIRVFDGDDPEPIETRLIELNSRTQAEHFGELP